MSTGQLRLTKHHGAGNDFLVILDADDRRPLTSTEVRVLCDRRRGVGADGVLRVMRGRAGSALTMDLHNADGSPAEMSGNGIRCLVQAAVDAGWVAPGPVPVATAAGLRTVHYRAGDRPGLGFASVDMGQVTLGPELDAGALPEEIAASVRFARTVDMGNPHIVLFGDARRRRPWWRVWARPSNIRSGAGPTWSSSGRAPTSTPSPCGSGSAGSARHWPVAPAPAPWRRRPTAGAWSGRPSSSTVREGPSRSSWMPIGVSLAGPTQKVADLRVDTGVLAELALTYDDELALADDNLAETAVVPDQ